MRNQVEIQLSLNANDASVNSCVLHYMKDHFNLNSSILLWNPNRDSLRQFLICTTSIQFGKTQSWVVFTITPNFLWKELLIVQEKLTTFNIFFSVVPIKGFQSKMHVGNLKYLVTMLVYLPWCWSALPSRVNIQKTQDLSCCRSAKIVSTMWMNAYYGILVYQPLSKY